VTNGALNDETLNRAAEVTRLVGETGSRYTDPFGPIAESASNRIHSPTAGCAGLIVRSALINVQSRRLSGDDDPLPKSDAMVARIAREIGALSMIDRSARAQDWQDRQGQRASKYKRKGLCSAFADNSRVAFGPGIMSGGSSASGGASVASILILRTVAL
jgi:hypothetical protein